MTCLPALRERLREEEETAAQEIEFEELIRRIPRLVGILPEALRDRSDARHNVALAKMISGLMAHLDEVQPHALVRHVHRFLFRTINGLVQSPSQVQPALVDQATKIRHIHSTARERFLRTVEVA
jgi:nuclear pore complex protein Nup98-Nup96